MSNKTGYLKQKATGDTIIPKTSAAAVYDAAKEQALSATLVDTPLKDSLGYPSFSTVTAYSEGDIVYYANTLWKCKAGGHAAGAWDADDFDEYSVKDSTDGLDTKKADKGSVETSSASTLTLTPGDADKTIVCGTLTALTIALPQEGGASVPKDTVATVEFFSGSPATTLTYSSLEIRFAGGTIPEIAANEKYLISVWRDAAVCTLL
jgi:hypothetical protein